jgi:hypothetical protein
MPSLMAERGHSVLQTKKRKLKTKKKTIRVQGSGSSL